MIFCLSEVEVFSVDLQNWHTEWDGSVALYLVESLVTVASVAQKHPAHQLLGLVAMNPGSMDCLLQMV
jgi:hypothetical protein